MALRIHGIVPLTDHVLVATRRNRDRRQFLGHGAAGDGQALAVEQAVREQHLEDLRHATGAVKIHRHIAA